MFSPALPHTDSVCREGQGISPCGNALLSIVNLLCLMCAGEGYIHVLLML